MSGFPINLDISEYFDDLRKFSSVYVNLEKCKDVRDVENHIKSVFGLEDNICLIHKKFLIPKSEDIQILQQYDIFKVQKCNFYDLQIHKTKTVNINSICEQKALNLTQSEKTIDLSCRPKQRIKGNICPSPGVPCTLTHPVESKKCSDSLRLASEHSILLNGNQNTLKEKLKHKKRKCLHTDESDDDDDVGNILDMSVKNSKRKKHSNCFSTDDGSLQSDFANDISHRDVTKDLHKKPKKRKKNSDGLNDTSLDHPSTCWESLTCDDVSIKDQSSKKKNKKVKEKYCNDSSVAMDANEMLVKAEPGSTADNYHEDKNCLARKKHKRNKKNGESKSPHDSEENQYYSSSHLCASKNNNLKKTRSFCENNKQINDESRMLEEQKKKVREEIDEILSKIERNMPSSETNSYDRDDSNSVAFSKKQSTTDHTTPEDYEESDVAENIDPELATGVDQISVIKIACDQIKRKRIRKHNKKKKRESLQYRLSVGPTLNHLASQQMVIESSPSSDISKHVFFTEDDFAEDMTVPSTPPIKSQTESSHLLNTEAGVTPTQGQSSRSETWQDQLLKLASSNSKPVVFHRSTGVATTTQPLPSSKPTQEDSAPALNPIRTDQSTSEKPVEGNPVAEAIQRCNGEVNCDDNKDQSSSSHSVDGASSGKMLSDICKPVPLPNDLQNVNLSDYPIIDKVVTKDLILFKVLKLNENCEPGVSKPILARVNGTSQFPERISLQIMEGCEECSHCTQAEGTGDAFIIELRWTDILEPRLFYP